MRPLRKTSSAKRNLWQRRLNLQPLEERAMLAIDSNFDRGLLTITSDGSDNLKLSSQGGQTKINDSNPTAGQIRSADVQRVRFEGGPESQVIDISQFARSSFPAIKQLVFANGPWVNPDRVQVVADEILGPGWNQKLKIENVEQYLLSGNWRSALADGTLTKQLTAAGWANADTLLDRVVAEAGKRAVIWSYSFGYGGKDAGFDVLFNGRLKQSNTTIAAPQASLATTSDSPPVASPMGFGGEGVVLNMHDSSAPEPLSSTAGMSFSVYGDQALGGDTNASFQWYTVVDTYGQHPATAGDDYDYVQSSGTCTFSPGQSGTQFTVTINPDSFSEPDETFRVLLSGATNAEIGDDEGIGTILDLPSLDISDVAVDEPTVAAQSDAVFTVTLSRPATTGVSILWHTQTDAGAPTQNQARSDFDYVNESGTISFAPGATALTITAHVKSDAVDEPDESFRVVLVESDDVAYRDDLIGIATIHDTDATPTISVSSRSITEPTVGDAQMIFTVSLSGPSELGASFTWRTQDGIAVSSGDYPDFTPVTLTGPLTFAPDATTIELTVNVNSDIVDEPDETFSVVLNDKVNVTPAAGSTTGVGTIHDTDDVPTVSAQATSVVENDPSGHAVVTLQLSHPSEYFVPVGWQTRNGTASATDGDYISASGTAMFALHQTILTLPPISIIDDTLVELDETFETELSGDSQYVKVENRQDIVTIRENDPNTITFGTQPDFTIPENSLSGAPVLGTINSEENVAPGVGPVEYEVVSGSGKDFFSVNSSTGHITFTGGLALDFEAQVHSYTLDVRATAPGTTASDTTTITIQVAPVNEPPFFDPESFEFFNVSENKNNSVEVGTVTAGDPETTAGRTFLLLDPSGNCSIDADTGQISTLANRPLDFEVQSTYQMTVEVRDNGSPYLSDVATVIVHVKDEPEAPSVADQVFTIPEDLPAGTIVGQIQATTDAGTSVTYQIAPGEPNNLDGKFALDASGKISVGAGAVLDFEHFDPGNPYHFVVEASNGHGSNRGTITIRLSNVNEPPTLTQPSPFFINENSPHFTTVGTLELTGDPDEPDSVTVSIRAGNTTPIGTGVFGIDPNTRQIYVADPHQLDYELKNTYQLVIEAMDNTIGTSIGSFLVTINVNDLPDTSNASDGPVTIDQYTDDSVVFDGIVRDFKAHNESGGHPDFEMDPYSGYVTGLVAQTLGQDGKPVLQSTTGIRHDNGLPGTTVAITSTNSFASWYNDDSNVNMTTTVPIRFSRTNSDPEIPLYRFTATDETDHFTPTSFFPIDGKLFGNYGTSGNNFHFTMELHATFTYSASQGENFELIDSDDDVWIFINHQLVVDIGGVHEAEGSTLTLNSNLKRTDGTFLNLVDGQTYPFDLFYAERHTSQSDLNAATTIRTLRPVGGHVLEEGNRFESTVVNANPSRASYDFVVPQNPQALAIAYSNLSFDLADTVSINDAFELALVDDQGHSLVPTIAAGKDAFFNVTEGEPTQFGSTAAQLAGSTVLVDISKLAPGIHATLVTRLVNDDGVNNGIVDTRTRVTLPDRIEFVPLPRLESNGQVVVEAEHHTGGSNGWKLDSTHNATDSAWQTTDDALRSGGKFVAVPNAQSQVDTGSITYGPRLDYAINFVEAGTYYVWVLGQGPSATDNAVHLGLDDALMYSSGNDVTFGSNWSWQGSTSANSRLQFTIAATGLHTLNLWMQRDGVRIDKLLVTKADTTPTDLGPLESSLGIRPASALPAGPTTTPLPPVAPDFSVLSDVSTGFTTSYGTTSFNDSTHVLYADLALTSSGKFRVRGDVGPLLLGIRNISNPLVRLQDPDGVTPDGMAYYDISRLAFTSNDALLDAHETVGGAQLKFFNPTKAQFSYELVVLGALNRAPHFMYAPATELALNNPNGYTDHTLAVDSDGDEVRYNVVSGPQGLQVDAQSGVIDWTPTAVGNYAVVIRANDVPSGAFADQSFTIHVTDKPNHAPRFTSIPIVDAFEGVPYPYIAQADDIDGDPLRYFVQPFTEAVGDFSIDENSGQISWTPTAELVGHTIDVTLRVTDRLSGSELLDALQPFKILVHPNPANRPPVITSPPRTRLEFSENLTSPTDNVSPSTPLDFHLDAGQTSSPVYVSVTAPGDGPPLENVDVFLLLDDTGSFSQVGPALAGNFGQVISSLTDTFSGIDFGFGVGRFEDYANISTVGPFDRPFILNQPIISRNAHLLDFDRVMNSALNRTAPGTGGFEDYPESYIEALYQVATGAGFDGDGNNSNTDNGHDSPLSAAQQKNPAPTSGDVPPFNANVGDPDHDVLHADGTRGGVGFRDGAARIILLATDVGPAFEPELPGITEITGSGSPIPVSLGDFEPIPEGLHWRDTTPGGRGATIQHTIDALNALGAYVIGLGDRNLASPRSSLEALAKLTGAVNRSAKSVDSGIPNDPVEPSEPYYFMIDGQHPETISDGVKNAISSLLGNLPITVQLRASDPSVHLHADPDPRPNVAVGEHADFSVTFTGDGSAHAFDLQFINPVNNFVLGSIPVTINYDYGYQVKATDPDGDHVTYSLVGSPAQTLAWASIDELGLIHGTPPGAGNYPFVVRASDGHGGEDVQRFTLVVGEGQSNEPPTIDSKAPTSVTLGQTYHYQVKASDPDQDTLAYLLENPTNSSIAIGLHTGEMTWTPSSAGVADVTVRVEDGRGGVARQPVHISTSLPALAPPNARPTFKSPPITTAVGGQTYLYRATAEDTDADSLSYSIVNGPAGLAIDRDTGVVTWSPRETEVGEYLVVLGVNDDRGGSDMQAYRLKVISLNEPPEITSTPLGPAGVNHDWSYPVKVRDPNGDPWTFHWETRPEGMQFDAETKTVHWTPGAPGDYRVAFAVDDGRGGVDRQEFVLTVATNTPPTINTLPPQVTLINAPYDYQVTIVDPDDANDQIHLTLDRNSYDRGMVVDDVNKHVLWTPTAVGEYPIQVTATDSANNWFTLNYTLLVVDPTAPNRAPRFTSEPLGPALEGVLYTYPVTATDDDGDPIEYSLVDQPDGMHINSGTGELTWTPSASGTFHVVVQVSDGEHYTYQPFDLPVVDDAPPTLELDPALTFAFGSGDYSFTVDGSDPNGDELTFSLENHSADLGFAMVKTDNHAVFTWHDPPVGSYPIDVRVTDDDGNFAGTQFTLVVYDRATNSPPQITGYARTTIQAGSQYENQIEASDPDGDPITYTLMSVDPGRTPPGLRMDDHGLVRWSTDATNITAPGLPWQYKVHVADDHGHQSPDQLFEIFVINGTPVNHAPNITSVPLGNVVIDRLYEYNAEADDPDHDLVRWSLDEAPDGMSIDAETGYLTWRPQAWQLGSHEVIVRATDALGLASQQTFTLTARGVNLPPHIDTTGDSLAVSGVTYRYRVEFSDPDDPLEDLRFFLDEAPTDGTQTMCIESEGPGFAVLKWTPIVSQTRDFSVTISVQDRDLAEARASYRLTVTTDTTLNNQAPVITSQPDMRWHVGQPYEYQVRATDDGPQAELIYSLESAPPNMSISATGELNWPNPTTAGSPFLITVLVQDRDGSGLGMRQFFNLVVVDDAAPSIEAILPASISAGALYEYSVLANDVDLASGDYLTYSIENKSPSNISASIDELGKIQWQSPRNFTGDAAFDVRVTDSYGKSAVTPVTIHVAGDTTGPQLVVWASQSEAQVGDEVTFTIRAFDDVDGYSVKDLTLWVDGQSHPVDPTGQITLPMTTAGNKTIHATARDQSGNQGTSSPDITIQVESAPSTPPIARITAPASDFTITEPVDIFGVVDDADPLDNVTYSLSLVPVDSADPAARIDLGTFAGRRGDASSSTGVPLGAKIIPSTLANGSYWLELVANDGVSPPQSAEPQLITINSTFKLGNFNLSFTDLKGSTGGIPLTVQRTYDSLNADRLGDFGYGWSLALTSGKMDIQLSDSPENDYWARQGFEPALFYGSRMTIKLPGGKELGFTAVPLPTDTGDGFGAGAILGLAGIFALGFQPDAGNTARLDLTGGNTFFYPSDYSDLLDQQLFEKPYNSFETVLDPTTGEFREVTTGADSSLGIPKNPHQFGYNYRLSMPDGGTYVFDSKTGQMLSYTDPRKNRLVFNGDSVASINPSGQVVDSITIHRDAFNRIDAITDFSGKSIRYDYDLATGDLASVTNRALETTSFAYDTAISRRAHFLTGIVDARGVNVLSATFDPATGQLAGLADAAGQSAGFSYTIDLGDGRSVERASDANGPTGGRTEIVHDRAGDVERRVQLVDNTGSPGTNRYLVTVYRHDSNHHQTAASVPFEVIGDLLRFTTGQDLVDDPAAAGFDASRWATRSTYNDKGYLTSTTDALGHPTYFSDFDSFGNPATIIDPLQRVTRNTYVNGQLLETRDAAGGVTKFHYDGNGNPDQQIQIAPIDGHAIVTSFSYDSRGRLISSTDPVNITRHFVYDFDGNQTLSYWKWDDPSPAAGGNGMHGDGVVDQTLVTRTDYDDEHRVKGTAQYTILGDHDYSNASQLDSLTADTSTLTSYNAAGQVESQTDQFGTITYTLYDIDGRVVETRTSTKDASGNLRWLVTRTAYDANGLAIAATDPYVVENTSGAPTSEGFNIAADSVLSPIRTTRTIYDSAGRVIETWRLADVPIVVTRQTGSILATPVYSAIFTAPTGSALANAILNRETTRYNGAGRVIETTTYDTTVGLDAILHRVYFQYDAAGRQTAVIQGVDLNQDGTLDVSDSDHDGIPDGGCELVRTTTSYDDAGQQETSTDALGAVTHYSYDDVGHVTRTVADMFGLQVTTEAHYDLLGRRDWAKDALGQTTDYQYDDLGRLKEVDLPRVDSGVTGSITGIAAYQYDYDVYGNQVRTRDPMDNDLAGGPTGFNRETTYIYDSRGRQLTRTLPDGLVERKQYNDMPLASLTAPASSVGLGELEYQVDFEGRVTAYRYDNSTGGTGHLAGKYFYQALADYTADASDGALGSAVQSVVYTYDALGRVVDINDSQFAAHTVEAYDADGRLTKIASPEGYLNYAYDKLGRMTRTWTSTDFLGADPINDTACSYDDLGRLKTVTVKERNDSGPIAENPTRYRYDKNGNLHQVQTPNGVITDYAYDSLNRLTHERVFADVNADGDFDNGTDTQLADYVYTLRADGKRTHAVETDDQNTVTTLDWVYDEMGRLTEERHDVAGTSTGDYIARYGFDLASNRVRMTKDVDNAIAASFAADETTTYAYDANDRLLTEIFDGVGANDTNTRYNYTGTDQTGKTVKAGLTIDFGMLKSHSTFGYDVRGQMSTTTIDSDGDTNNDQSFTYEYNDDGIRVSQTDVLSGQITIYHVDPNNPTGFAQVLEEGSDANADGRLQAGEIAKSYTVGLNVIAQSTGASGVLFLLRDAHGSTRALVDPTAIVQQRFAYDAYGGLLALPNYATLEQARTSLLFAGEQVDRATGLGYLRNRYLQFTTGRFLSLDTASGNLEDPISLHKYLYANANPGTFVDPNGTSAIGEGIKRLLRGVGVELGIRILIGIRATYVIGADYKDQPQFREHEVYVNQQVGRFTDDQVPVDQWVSVYNQRPDIVDRNLGTVYEVKSELEAPVGLKKVPVYVAALNRYWGRVDFHAGTWSPAGKSYTLLDLPGMNFSEIPGLAALQFTARNIGGGVIVYETNIPISSIAAVATAIQYAKQGAAFVSAFRSIQLGESMSLSVLVSAIGGFAF